MKKYFLMAMVILAILFVSVPLSAQKRFNPFEDVVETVFYYLNIDNKDPNHKLFKNKAALMKQVGKSLLASQDYTVVYEDIMGEGTGAMDAGLRYPEAEVNCMIWLQLVLSDIYGQGLKDKTPVMDKIRYYGGHAAFGMRKHFIGRWLAIDPGPLKLLDLTKYEDTVAIKKHRTKLNLERFRRSMRYNGRLYREDVDTIDLTYVTGRELYKLVPLLEKGYYVMFELPNEHYLNSWAHLSGPLGLVHSFVIEVGDDPDQRKPGAPVKFRSHDASIISGKVGSESLSVLVKKTKGTARGFVIYELDPHWDYSKPDPLNLESFAILARESTVKSDKSIGTTFPEAAHKRIPKSVKKQIAEKRAERRAEKRTKRKKRKS